MTKELSIITKKEIENRIYIIRGVQVMLDRDLAKLYQTETRTLKQTVKEILAGFLMISCLNLPITI